MLKVFESFLENCGYSDLEVKHLKKEVSEYRKISYGHGVRIGLIGDAGVGKSSLINSILGIPNVTAEVSLRSAKRVCITVLNSLRAMTGTAAHMW